MEHQGQYGGRATSRVDEYGNPVGTGVHGGGMGTHTGAGAGGGQFQATREEHKTGGILHRSGSSSSSSSEDDGMGGRRKKGIKDKIKEKLPGGNKDNQQGMGTGGAFGQHGQAGMTGGTYGQQQAGHGGMMGGTTAHSTEGTGEKKGIMDKIKDKLPGQH